MFAEKQLARKRVRDQNESELTCPWSIDQSVGRPSLFAERVVKAATMKRRLALSDCAVNP
jgi:hypothetical protein